MRKEMKNKNRMLLALVVVAALAVVSVAGVAISEKADAANRYDQMNGGTTIFTSDDSSLNAQFYILPGDLGIGGEYGIQYVTIKDGVTISGTISVGTADNRNGDNFVEYASVTLDGVSNAVFTLMLMPDEDGKLVGVIMVGDAAAPINQAAALPQDWITNYKTTTGTIEVTKGAIVAGAIRSDFASGFNAYAVAQLLGKNVGGNLDVVYQFSMATGTIAQFTGTIKAAESELSVAYVYGLAVGIVDGRSVVFGEVVSNAAFTPWKKVTALDKGTTPVDESQIYNKAGIPTYVGPNPVLPAQVPANNADEALNIAIPAVEFSQRNVTFVTGDWSVGFPEGFTDVNNQNVVGNIFRLVNISGVVEEAANVIVGDNMPVMAKTVVVTAPEADTASTDMLYLLPEKGAAIPSVYSDLDVNDDKVEFTFSNVMLNTPYTVAGYLNGFAYMASFEVSGSGADYTVNVGTNQVFGAIGTATAGISVVGDNLIFDNAEPAPNSFVSEILGAWGDEAGALKIDNAMSSTSVAVLDTESQTQTVFVYCLQNNIPVLFIGAPAAPTTNVVPQNGTQIGGGGQEQYLAAPSSAVLSNKSVLPEDLVTKFQLRTAYDTLAGGNYAAGYTFLVRGTMDIQFTSVSAPEIRGLFDMATAGSTYNLNPGLVADGTNGTVYNINLEGTGLISYGVNPQQNIIPGNHPMFSMRNLNAAYYIDNAFPTSTTYNYTTLNNALDNSNNVTIFGWIFILDDITLAGPDAEAPTVVSILRDSGLVVGWKDSAAGRIVNLPAGMTPPAESADPIIQVPENSSVEKLYNAQYGVAFGQAVYDVEPTRPANIPVAEVLIEGDKFIYTDLWTALDITVSGDTIDLLMDAILDLDGTLKGGVTLVDAPFDLEIDADVIFTVDGLLDSTTEMEINGMMVVNGEAKFTGGAAATLGEEGSINVTKSGVLTVGGDGETNQLTGDGSIYVDGVMNAPGIGSVTDVNYIHVTGTVNVNADATVTASGTLVVGVVPTLSTGYINSAVIDGVVSLGPNALAIVFGEFDFNTTGVVSTQYLIPTESNDILYATAYAVADGADLPTLWLAPTNYVESLLDINILDWFNGKAYERADALSDNIGVVVGDENWTKVYAQWTWKTYQVTLANAAGVNWDAHAVDGSWSNTTASGNITGAGTFDIRYGAEIMVTAYAAAGYSGTPTVKLNEAAFTNGSTFKVTSGALFTSSNLPTTGSGESPSGESGNSWGDPIVILLIVIIIIIAVIAIVVAAKMLRS